MQGYHPDGNKRKIHFHYLPLTIAEEEKEFKELISVLESAGCKYIRNYMLPEYDIYEYDYGNGEFLIWRGVVIADEIYIYCEDAEVMSQLEELFHVE